MSEESPEENPSKPWGPLVAPVLGLLLMLVYGGTQFVATIAAAVWKGGDLGTRIAQVALDGDVIALGIAISMVPTLLLLWVLMRARHRLGALSMRPPRRVILSLALWTVVLMAVNFGLEQLGERLGVPPIPASMLAMYRSTDFLPLFAVVIIVLGPLFEELLFRGLLFDSWANSRLGVWGAIGLTALFWSLIHAQYLSEPFYLVSVATIGLVIGLARHRTGTLFVPLGIHFINNAVALVQMAHA